MPKHDIFVSYPHVHEQLVHPLVKLLRVGERLVFFDRTSIEPGTEWENAIRTALTEAKYIVVIWCDHSNKSDWIKKETEIASQLQKAMIPVILDKTPLPEHISKFQWIDFTGAFTHEMTSPVVAGGAAAGAVHGSFIPPLGSILGWIIGATVGVAKKAQELESEKGSELSEKVMAKIQEYEKS